MSIRPNRKIACEVLASFHKFWNVLVKDLIKMIQIKWLSNVSIETKFIIYNMYVAIAAHSDYRQVGIYALNGMANGYAFLSINLKIQHDNVWPAFFNHFHEVFLEFCYRKNCVVSFLKRDGEYISYCGICFLNNYCFHS